MLYSSNPDDVKLAAGIISARQGGSEIVDHVVELLSILMDVSTKLSAKIWTHRTMRPIPTSAPVADALKDINDQIIRLSKETWVDPITMMTQALGAASLSKDPISDDDISIAL